MKIKLKLVSVDYGEKSTLTNHPWMIEDASTGKLWFAANSFKTEALANAAIDYYFSWNEEYERMD